MARADAPAARSERRAEFPPTHWSDVLAAGSHGATEAPAALDRLCRAYWFPLYAYLRRRGLDPADAEDLTQQFFAQLLDGDFVARADPAKGKFRSYMLSGIKYLLGHERERAGRLKRGGGTFLVPLDQTDAEARCRREPSDTLTPERAFERAWLAALLDAAGRRLRDEYESAGKGADYDLLKDCRLDAPDHPSYAEIAVRLGLSPSAVKSAIWRLRRRHEELVRDEIARTLGANDSVDDEIRYLLDVARER